MSLGNIAQLESALWETADQLRANSNLQASEYCIPVLGIIFLRHANNRYEAAAKAIEAEQVAGTMPRRPLVPADFIKRRALMLPEAARFDRLLAQPKGSHFAKAIVAAMDAIEEQFEPLKGQLPKDYDRFDSGLLEHLLRIFDRAELRNAQGDVFGRIYEYFLMKFAIQGAQDSGEFFTPPSIVQTIVNVIEPDHGTILDPACGSGGMFVQSSHFIEQHGQDTAKRVTFFGQEKTATTIRLAKMNLAVHGLEGDIREANTFYQDEHELVGKCDFVMANPPFNVDAVDAGRVKDDIRLPFGLPGVNKGGKVGNGNYLWISYFYSYLNSKGRAGFVMSSQASSAGHGEMEVRRKLVQTGDVDVMMAIRGNFFYTRTVPCELWFFDKGKPAERLDTVLMLDARNVYRKVTRKIFDFSPEQQQNLAAVVWLYRGQGERFVALLGEYVNDICDQMNAMAQALGVVLEKLQGLVARDVLVALEAQAVSAQNHFTAFWLIMADAPAPTLAHMQLVNLAFAPVAAEIKKLQKDLDGAWKLAVQGAQAEEGASAKDKATDRRALQKRLRDTEEAREVATGLLRQTLYAYRQLVWLLERFPHGKFVDVAGLCKAVTRKEIESADWSLTPARYVGVAPAEVDEDFDFAEAMRAIHEELAELNAAAVGLAERIQENLAGLIA